MIETSLTRERIIEAAEDVLRRFGPAKATVVDVARALGVSHGSVYRHFPSKAALRDAVTERWLVRVSEPLAVVAAEEGPAPERLRRWFELLMRSKKQLLLDDPELFATYSALVSDARDVVRAHIETLNQQIARILADGIARGELTITDPIVMGRAVFNATTRFHNPIHAAEWTDPASEAAFEGVWQLILRGLGAAPGAVTGAP